MTERRWSVARARALLVLLLVALLLPHPAAATDPPEPVPASPAELPLPVLVGQDEPAIDPEQLAASLAPLLADPALGVAPGASILDGATGELLLGQRHEVAVAPASSLKIATALAVLAEPGPAYRVTTSVEADAAGIVLVGGGDPTLLTADPAQPAAYGPVATLAELAQQTATALQGLGATAIGVRYDAGLFSGPSYLADWDPGFVGLGLISPVSALTLDPAAAGVSVAALRQDPAATTAAWFVERLNSLGIAATLAGPGTAAASATRIAAVESAPLVALVDRMLDLSDNDVAEALFRLAAINRGLPGTFDGGSRAVTATLQELQVPIPGLVVRDGSGLSRENRVAPITLASALQAAAVTGPAGRDLSGITWAPPGLPVGGLTGSLGDRFDSPATEAAAGRVRAKTGTLTGVSSLTGVVATEQGRPGVFAVLASETAETTQARAALDRVAAGLAACGCPIPAS